jgi:hypothetical protein
MAVCAFAVLRSDIARASEVADADRVLATELFREGRSLLAEKRYAEACRKLQESERLDPSGGTLLNLALCHELEGRTAMAWSEFHEAIAVARRDERDDREEEARRHIEALEPRLARLTIAVPPSAQLPELTVRLDGALIRAPAWGATIPIDRGAHVVDVEAPGRVAWRASIEIEGEGTGKTVEIPRLEPVATPAPLPAPAPMVAAPPAPPLAVVRPVRREAPTPIGPAILIGAGVASLAAGTFFGLHSFDEKRARDAACPAGSCSGAAFIHDADAMSSATVSTAAVAAGFALTAAGGTWFFVDRAIARRSEEPSRVRSSGPWVLGALGLASVAAGAYFGMRAFGDKRARDAACPTGRGGCSPAALRDDADAHASASLSDVMFGAGAITLAGGAALWLYGASRPANSAPRWGAVPMLTRQATGLLLEGDIE